MASGTTVDVKVPDLLKQFIVASVRSDTVDLRKGDELVTIILNRLTTIPEGWKPVKDRAEYIRIKIPNVHRDINVDYRNYLNESDQQYVVTFLKRRLKTAIMFFILGQVTAGSQQNDAIREFFLMYDYSFSTRDFDAWKKSWDRSPHKDMWKKNSSSFCPLF